MPSAFGLSSDRSIVGSDAAVPVVALLTNVTYGVCGETAINHRIAGFVERDRYVDKIVVHHDRRHDGARSGLISLIGKSDASTATRPSTV